MFRNCHHILEILMHAIYKSLIRGYFRFGATHSSITPFALKEHPCQKLYKNNHPLTMKKSIS